MTRRPRDAARVRLVEQAMDAADRYRRHFGEGAPVVQFMHRPLDLARELNKAVAENRRVDDDELYRRLGMEKPPPDVEL
jgi:hypothetical protein